MLRRSLLPLTAGIALYAASVPAALAGPTCNVDIGMKSLFDCLVEVDPGGIIVVPDRAILTVDPLVINTSVTIRPANAGQTIELRHSVTSLGSPVFTEPDYPFNADALITVRNGAALVLEDARLTPANTNNVPRLQHSRGVDVIEGSFTGTNITMDGYRTLDDSTALRGVGFVARAKGADSTATFIDSTFNNFDARRHKGAVFYATEGGTISIEGDSTLDGNLAGHGGAAYADNEGIITVNAGSTGAQPTFANNNAKATGGAIAASTSASVNISAGAFINNSSGGSGGHVALDSATGTIEQATFSGGSAFRGGIFYAESASTLTIRGGARLELGVVSGVGGAILAEESTLTVLNAYLGSNLAEGEEEPNEGGAIRIVNGELTVEYTTFEANRATEGAWEGFGGAISATDLTSTTLSYNRFLGNEASEGGALSLFSTSGTEAIVGNLFCGNEAQRAAVSQFSGTGELATLVFTNNIVDGEGSDAQSEQVNMWQRDYRIEQNTFIRFGSAPALRLSGGSTGEYNRNFAGFGGNESVISIEEADLPTTMESNAWYDTDGTWLAPVSLSGAGAGGGDKAVYTDPRFTLLQAGQRFNTPCSEFDHGLRPDSPLVLVDVTGGALSEEQQQAGVLGALGTTASRQALWDTDADSDGVPAIWDCDDGDRTLGARYEQYYDADGDGVAGTQVEAYLCVKQDEYTDKIEDCHDDDPTLTEPCEPDETDDTDSPDPAPEEVYWFGSGCSASQTPAVWLWLALPFVLLRRRRS